MELIMINDAKLKVMLTHEDLVGFDMEEGELDYSNTETKRMLWDILNQAKHSIGFDTDGHRVLVQLYPSREGGCEMFVTKLGHLYAEHDPYDEEEDEDSSPEQRFPCKTPHRSHSESKIRPAAFGFDRLEWLITVCRRLKEIGYAGNSLAWRCDDCRYYLFLDTPPSLSYLPPDEFSFILEYGTRENTDTLQAMLGEHGKIICPQDAVEQLGVL